MTIVLPGAMFAAGIALYLFYEIERVKQAKKEERKERLDDKREQFLQLLIESKRKEKDSDQPPAKAEIDEPPGTSSPDDQ